VRVVQVCPYAWDAPGGVQIHVRDLTERLRAGGHDVVVLAPALHRGDPEAGVRVVGRAVRFPYQGTVAPIAPAPWSLGPIRRTLDAVAPDLVHVHEPLTPSTSMYATLASTAPVVATFHAHAERSRLFDLAAPLVRPVWRRLRARVAVSEAAREFVVSRMGDGVRVIPNGVDIATFSSAEAAPNLPEGRRMLWAGRLDRQKGFPVAVRAFDLLARDVADLAFVVAGDGRDRGAVEGLSPDARRRTVMLGAVPHDRLPAYFTGAAVFVSPALGQESFGMVLVEAMAAGVPVVATRIAGYDEVVRDGRDGLLVPPGDIRSLAAAVRRVLDDPGLTERLSAAGRERAREFDWKRVAGRIEDVYREVVRIS
jgi:phosphatidylinositol alpha-mannosyltransferase